MKINEEVSCSFKGKVFKIGITEMDTDWEPFLGSSFPDPPLRETDDGDNNERDGDDGVSNEKSDTNDDKDKISDMG